MIDLRQRLADSLNKQLDLYGDGISSGHMEMLVDSLLSLPGIAIVELPDGSDVGQGWTQFKNVVVGPGGDIRDEGSAYPPVQHNAATARSHAAALLAAANKAEQSDA